MAYVIFLVFADARAGSSQSSVRLPVVASGPKRLITIDDVLRLRRVDSLTMSPDGSRFAIFLRRADPDTNAYHTGWFVGSVSDGALIYIGDGGAVGPTVGGSIESPKGKWSPDGQWLAYTLEHDGEVQLWRSRFDGQVREQITHHAADVLDFAWSEDGRGLYFTAALPRAKIRAAERLRARSGYRYDDDLLLVSQLLTPWSRPTGIPAANLSHWFIGVGADRIQSAVEADQAMFERARKPIGSRVDIRGESLSSATPAVAVRPDGAVAWLKRIRPRSLFSRVTVSRLSSAPDAIVCAAEECIGYISGIWWSDCGDRVFFYRRAGVDFSTYEFYSWLPETNELTALLRAPDDEYQHCRKASHNRLICVRETPMRPSHIVAIDLRTGTTRTLVELNPEFRNIRVGQAERIEWDTPKFDWNESGGRLAGMYPDRAYGYVVYPPDFDQSKRYPVIIDPYVAKGFESSVGQEHAQHVYAAHGFIVIKTSFPSPVDPNARFGASLQSLSYSSELDFPHLSMYMDSTLRALDLIIARGFVDPRRVGIGGVSHGSFVPQYMLQRYDRITAISISGPGWTRAQYYASTQSSLDRRRSVFGEWPPSPEDEEGRDYWGKLDLADNVAAVEAPILMHLAAYETFALTRLIRLLADADKPYDAYVFPNETHTKWQPAHLSSIMNRNLDWFRFWLQGYEDPAIEKVGQYARWRELRKLQCRNPRSLLDYCEA